MLRLSKTNGQSFWCGTNGTLSMHTSRMELKSGVYQLPRVELVTIQPKDWRPMDLYEVSLVKGLYDEIDEI